MSQAIVIQGGAPVPPSTPGPSQGTGARIVTTGALKGVPVTQREVEALQARRKMLSDQLISVTDRRREVARQLRSAVTGADKTGLEQRLAVIDARIARLEADIDESGQQIAAAPAAYVAVRRDPGFVIGPRSTLSNAAAPLLAVFMIFVLCPMAISFGRMLWRRGTLRPAVPADTTQRLERIEQAIDAIAIEVERVSEGQRFVTRLLAEGGAANRLGGGGTEPARVSRGERTPV